MNYDTILHKGPPNTESLTYVFLNLAMLIKKYPQLKVKYHYSETTQIYFLLLQPVDLYQDMIFLKKVSEVMVKFMESFPDEGLVMTEKKMARIFSNSIEILTPNGFNLPAELLSLIAKPHQSKFSTNPKYKKDKIEDTLVAEPSLKYKKTKRTSSSKK